MRLFVSLINGFGLPPNMRHILNQHDPESAVVHNSFALTVCGKVPL